MNTQECCDTPRGFVNGTCDYCGGTVQPEPTESNTPETDVECDDAQSNRGVFDALSKERDELLNKTVKLKDSRDCWKKRERDQRKWHHKAIYDLVAYKRERDELLEALGRVLNATALNHRNDRWHQDAEYVLLKAKLNQ